MIKSTRLRYLIAKSPESLAGFISELPFKVELKSIMPNGDSFIAFFVIPEIEGFDFKSIDLRGIE